MKVLVTGDLGFLGRALRAEMEDHGHKIIGFDVARRPQEDVCVPSMVNFAIQSNRCDVVVHLAAQVGRLNCEQNPVKATAINQLGTMNVAMACERFGVPLVYVSTSEVYGDHGGDVVDEDTVENTSWFTGMYATTKFAGEIIANTYGPSDLKIVRPTMPYGPGVAPGPGRRALDNLVHQALTGQPMVVHRGAARSWCWVGDVASGIRYVIDHGEPNEVYNVGRDDEEISMLDLAFEIERLVEASGLVREVDPPPLQTLVKRISCAKLRHLGWAPEVDLDEGLPKMVEWVRGWIAAHEGHLVD